MGQEQRLTAYAVDMIQVCKPTEKDINEQSHTWFPMALTFPLESDGQEFFERYLAEAQELEQ